MALSATQTSIVNLVTAMFNAAPGKDILADLEALVNGGRSLDDLANDLAGTGVFKTMYPSTMTDNAFAVAFINNLVGSTLTDANKALAVAYTEGQLNSGLSRAQTIKAVSEALASIDNADPNFGAASATYENQLQAAANYSETQSSTDLAVLQGAISGVTADPATIPAVVVVPVVGQSYPLTTGVDTLTGGADNDTFNGVSDGVTSTTVGAGQTVTETFGGLDVLDGGAGNDTLNLTNATGTMTLDTSVAVSNIENLALRSANAAVTADVQAWTGLESVSVQQLVSSTVDVDTKGNATSVTVTGTATSVDIDDNHATADTLATVAVTGNTGLATVTSDALTTLSLTDSTGGATVAAAAATRALTVNLNNATAGTVTDATATAVTVNAAGVKSSGVTVAAGAATAVTLDAAKDLTLSALTANLATTLTVTGDAKVTVATDTLGALTTIDASANTGGLTIGDTLAASVAYTGSTGADTIAVGATTKAVATGLGDDTVGMTVAVGTGGSVDAGDGTDTLALTSTAAAALSLTSAFEGGISNFEKVSLGATALGATDNVNLANLDDISHVVSAGTAAGAGQAEVTTVTFNSMLEGQTVTVNGQNYVATSDMTGAQAASAFSGATTIADGIAGNYSEAVSGAVITYTGSANGNATDLAATVTNSAAVNAPTAVTTDGVAVFAGTTESSVVTFQGLIAGESVTAAGRIVTATAITETAVFDFSGSVVMTDADAFTINGLTFTAANTDTNGDGATTVDVIAAILSGATSGDITVTGTVTNALYVPTNNAGVITYTSSVGSSDITDLVYSDDTGTYLATNTTPTLAQGNSGSVTAAEVATAMSSGATSGAAVVSGALALFTAGAAATNTVTYTSTTATTAGVTDIVVSTTAGSAPTVVTTQGVNNIVASTETAIVTFNALLSGQSIAVAGRTITANGDDLSAAAVEAAFLGGVNTGFAVVGGTLALWTVADTGGVGDGTLQFTSTTANTPMTDIALGGTSATPNVAPAIAITQGNTTSGGGALNLTNLAANATVELTGANAGSTTATLASDAGSSDTVNLMLNGAANLAAGLVTIANVETIAITATDSSADTTTVTNPLAVSTLTLNAAAATTVSVAGNHGVNFTGSTVTNVTTLDASAVAGNVNTTGLSAAAIVTANGIAGAVTFTTAVTGSAVTITTGNGDDLINASSVGTTGGSAVAATITTGAGKDTVAGGADADVIDTGSENDIVNSSTGADAITLGAGNDQYFLNTATDSVLATRDVIADFSANTFGQGTAGAVNSKGATGTVGDRTGDIIDIDSILAGGITDIDVGVFANAADAQTFLQNTGTASPGNTTTGIALDSTTGLLYIDNDSNGTIDSVIELTGVTTIDEAAFVIV